MRTVEVPGAEALSAAREVVQRHLVPTPVIRVPALGDQVLLKLESFQPTGSFKVRGALAAVAAAQFRQPDQPVVTASAGNHGLGVAFAADRLAAEATVVVAETASEAKIRALGDFGARLIRHGAAYDEAEAFALALADEQGGHFISPYNDPDVIAGQGTVGVELLAQVPDLESIIVPVGGGGLCSGVGLVTAGRGVRLFGVEPQRSTVMRPSVEAGKAVHVDVGHTMADGLAGNIEPGSTTVGLVGRFASGLLAVSEEEIARAVRFLAFEVGLVVEPSGAVGVAVLLSGSVKPGNGPMVVVISGRNVSTPLLVSLLSS